ncbi:MAG: ATP-binding cassette domain-containing protein [Nocardioides sp.]
MSEPVLEVEGLRKSYADKVVLADVDLAVAPGDVVCLIGASGSGKSTLLRCLNLLEDVDDGVIRFQGEEVSDPGSTGARCAAGWAWSSRASTCSRT